MKKLSFFHPYFFPEMELKWRKVLSVSQKAPEQRQKYEREDNPKTINKKGRTKVLLVITFFLTQKEWDKGKRTVFHRYAYTFFPLKIYLLKIFNSFSNFFRKNSFQKMKKIRVFLSQCNRFSLQKNFRLPSQLFFFLK